MIFPRKTVLKDLPHRAINTAVKYEKINKSPLQQNMASISQQTESPASFLRRIIGETNSDDAHYRPSTFQKPSEQDIADYDLDAVRAIRSRNLEKLKELHEAGKSLNACNQFGESLLHMACRRGDIDTVNYMIQHAGVLINIRDDFGRNPFHDACWTSQPNLDLMSALMEAADPNMLLAEDVRGSTPFDYARREHFEKWNTFLESKKEYLIRRMRLARVLE
jgi:ankyrin repeat protein